MKITLEATGTVERVQGTPCRKWIGATDAGTKVHAWIAIVQPQTHDAAALAAFERELSEVKLERQLVSIDHRLVI
ncbi:MAG: hypothetical protein HXY30_09185 [Pseudorhodoplanes sp.]|nr:hypothetical protein [Pseudorhodoplanes sp.]